MDIKNTYFFWVLIILFVISCKTNPQPIKSTINNNSIDTSIRVGASQLKKYLPLLKGKRIAVVGNQTSIIKNSEFGVQNYTHLVDVLLTLNVNIKIVFSPEHGFRGKADAGEKVVDNIDTTTGLPIISLYGSNKKPKPEQLKNIDIIIFDLQDVGVRFYTYISTLHYVMEAAAEANIKIIVLDRPNPNAHYIDGPMLEDKHQSFVGMHPVPIVYGMTIGEYAQMINGEKWLRNGIQCDLTVIPINNYSHHLLYNLPVKPSPNLPNSKAINLYPSLCFFEGTSISCGRGTEIQFQIFGSPKLPKNKYPFSFTPKPNEGAKHPKHQDNNCNGLNLTNISRLSTINIQWLLDSYRNYPKSDNFFNSFFTKLAGTEQLQNQIELGYSQNDIKKTWQPSLEQFKKIRAKYLLYD
jgi:uncharacterized protein YbbC (DUF1343 family)